MCGDKFERRQIKMGSGVPTIPASTDHRNGDWIATDIYDGEFYMDTDTGLTYTRNGASIQTAGKGSENFANADLTLTGNRTHDLDDNYVFLNNGNLITSANNGTAITATTSDGAFPALEVNNTNGSAIALAVTNGRINTVIYDVYATDALAGAAGVPTNTIYMTPTGELRIKL
jgi:hypothetical protein